MSLLKSKKFKELQQENEELKKLIDGLSDKENQLKNFDDLVKKARLEFANISAKKDQTAQKLETLQKEKTKLTTELKIISSDIKQLREIKLSEKNQILSMGKATDLPEQSMGVYSKMTLKEIEAAEKRKSEITSETFKLNKIFDETKKKINEGEKVLNSLTSEIEKKKEEISSLIERQMLISDDQYKSLNLSFGNKNIDEAQLRIGKLEANEKELTEMINNRKQLLTQLDKRIREKKAVVNSLSGSIDSKNKLTQKEFSENEQVLELDIKIEAMETKLALLTDEFKSKKELTNDLQTEYLKISEDLESGKNELSVLTEAIEIATVRLTDLDNSLTFLDKEFEKISREVSDKMALREKLDEEISEKKNQKTDLEKILKELKETTTIIAQLKNDIESGSGQSAKRFTGVIQYYSTLITDITKKKTLVEKDLSKKLKELKSRENLINEKQLVLDEMENVLVIRHNKLKLFEDLTRKITGQRELLEKNILTFNESVHSTELIVNSETHQKKLLEFENALKELLHNSDKYSGDLTSTRMMIEKEIFENKKRLNELNQNIRQSTTELSSLRDSINKIKVEHEEHRVSINKLGSVKTKLEEQIEKHKQVIDKYASIKDKIRQEQELIKKKRELSSTAKSSGPTTKDGKTFEPNNPNWIKL
jgi:chromosome segregation ATPase